jgi:hypothetical protein
MHWVTFYRVSLFSVTSHGVSLCTTFNHTPLRNVKQIVDVGTLYANVEAAGTVLVNATAITVPVLDLVSQFCDVVLVRCIFSSGKPPGGRDFGMGSIWGR